ncbi:TPA: hypothetical protein ACH3X1_001243 [Trebouxia sp. C0004]
MQLFLRDSLQLCDSWKYGDIGIVALRCTQWVCAHCMHYVAASSLALVISQHFHLWSRERYEYACELHLQEEQKCIQQQILGREHITDADSCETCRRARAWKHLTAEHPYSVVWYAFDLARDISEVSSRHLRTTIHGRKRISNHIGGAHTNSNDRIAAQLDQCAATGATASSLQSGCVAVLCCGVAEVTSAGSRASRGP